MQNLVMLGKTMAELSDSLVGRTRFTHFCKYLVALCSWPETASDVMSGTFVGPIVHDKLVKFGDLGLNCSREIPPKAVVGCISTAFLTSITANWK